MKILHILNDWVICDYVPAIMEYTSDEHVYVRLTCPGAEPPRHLNARWGVQDIAYGSVEYFQHANSTEWDAVWVHGLLYGIDRFLLRMNPRVKVIWSTWGFDYQRYGVQWLYGLRTSLLLPKYLTVSVFLKKIAEWAGYHTGLYRLLSCPIIRVLKRIDYFSTVLPVEKDMVGRLLRKNAKPFVFHYISPKKTIERYHVVNLASRNILLGNSADVTNNHFDVIHAIRHIVNFDIWAPLSYDIGGVRATKYADDVASYGKRCFGQKFHAMKKFMPYDSYVKLLEKCSVYIFGHRRQKAIGNIHIGLMSGAVIVLDHNSPAYQHFNRLGIRVYSLVELKRRGVGEIMREYASIQEENIKRYMHLANHEVLFRTMIMSIMALRTDILAGREGVH